MAKDAKSRKDSRASDWCLQFSHMISLWNIGNLVRVSAVQKRYEYSELASSRLCENSLYGKASKRILNDPEFLTFEGEGLKWLTTKYCNREKTGYPFENFFLNTLS